MKRVTNQEVVERVIEKRGVIACSEGDFYTSDIENAYCDLRTERHGSDGWMRHGSSWNGGALLNGLREEREERISELVWETAKERREQEESQR